MPNFVIGTAGHVDHGKTALIKALTGIDADRLPEEKKRGLTLDLGFAHITLPSGVTCGIIDVPGHERYLKNMLIGVGGFDFALLVIDAVEGVKAQTREHLDILQLLNIQSGLSVITKIDKVTGEEIVKREAEIRDFLKGTFLEKKPVVRVSSHTRYGLENLINQIDATIKLLKPKDEEAPFRMPIDRVFVKQGFGTIVTGTVYQGSIEEDMTVIIVPLGKKCKIRKIEIHKKPARITVAGQRVALNLSGILAEDVRRGDQAIAPGALKTTNCFDSYIKILASSPHVLKNRDEIKLYVATSEVSGYVRLLDAKKLEPGQQGFAQVFLKKQVAVLPGDRFIMRGPSALFTLGGGKILDTEPTRHRRSDKAVLEMLEMKDKGDYRGVLENLMSREPFIVYSMESLSGAASMPIQKVTKMLQEMEKTGKIYTTATGGMILKKTMEDLSEKTINVLESLQRLQPWQLGRKADEIRRNLPEMEDRLFREIMIQLKKQEKIREKKGLISTGNFSPELSPEKEKCYSWIKQTFDRSGFAPPTKKKLAENKNFNPLVIEEVIEYMIFRDELVFLDERILFATESLNRAKKLVGNFIIKNKSINPVQAKELLKTTRKFIIPLLEYFDKIYFTRRKGNIRVLFRENVIVEG